MFDETIVRILMNYRKIEECVTISIMLKLSIISQIIKKKSSNFNVLLDQKRRLEGSQNGNVDLKRKITRDYYINCVQQQNVSDL